VVNAIPRGHRRHDPSERDLFVSSPQLCLGGSGSSNTWGVAQLRCIEECATSAQDLSLVA
jgi:hypothetical protein